MNKDYKIEALILDMDGVLWRDTEPIGNLPSLFKSIEERGWKPLFVTNNATRSVNQYVEKLSSFGIEVDQSQIVNSECMLLAKQVCSKPSIHSGISNQSKRH
jgi:ribonucleotide monophosphatase NagD (HAD superfamily)